MQNKHLLLLALVNLHFKKAQKLFFSTACAWQKQYIQALNRACIITMQLEMQTGIVVKQKQYVSKALRENFNSKGNKQIAKAVAK
jgi:hypothetical protein